MPHNLKRWWLLGAAFILVFGSVGLVACNDDEDEDETTVEDVEEAGGAEDADGTPEVTFGQTVTVTGDVGEVIGDQAFVLEGEGGFFGIGQSEVLVVSETALNVQEGDEVQVTGTVQEFRADVEQQFNLNLEDADIDVEEGDAYIEATSVSQVGAETPTDGDDDILGGDDETPTDGDDIFGDDETPTNGG